MVEDEQAFDIAAAPQIGGEAGGVLPGQVTQEAELAGHRLQEAEGHRAERHAQTVWRREADRRSKTKRN